MKIRKMVKKTMAAAMLTLMACTSMSAMAASEWVWTSQELRGAGKTFDEICEAVVASRAHTARPWKVEYLGSWYLISDRTVYCRAINEFDNQNFVAGGFVCDKGKFFFNDPDHPDGCYEFKEPNPVPPMEENSSWCNLVNPNGVMPHGNVACLGEDIRSECVWGTPSWVTDEEAITRVRYCIREHEKHHIQIEDSMGSYCNDKSQSENPTFTLYTDKPNRYLGEMLSYEESMVCLEQQRDQCNTKACYDQVERTRKSDADAIILNGDLYRDWHTEQEKSD